MTKKETNLRPEDLEYFISQPQHRRKSLLKDPCWPSIESPECVKLMIRDNPWMLEEGGDKYAEGVTGKGLLTKEIKKKKKKKSKKQNGGKKTKKKQIKFRSKKIEKEFNTIMPELKKCEKECKKKQKTDRKECLKEYKKHTLDLNKSKYWKKMKLHVTEKQAEKMFPDAYVGICSTKCLKDKGFLTEQKKYKKKKKSGTKKQSKITKYDKCLDTCELKKKNKHVCSMECKKYKNYDKIIKNNFKKQE